MPESFNNINWAKLIQEGEEIKEEMRSKIKELRRDIEKDPSDTERYLELGDSYFSLGEFDKAVHFLNRTLELDPNLKAYRPDVYYLLSVALSELGHHEEALEAAEQSISTKIPAEGYMYEQLGDSFSMLKRHKEAADAYIKSLVMGIHNYEDIGKKIQATSNELKSDEAKDIINQFFESLDLIEKGILEEEGLRQDIESILKETYRYLEPLIKNKNN